MGKGCATSSPAGVAPEEITFLGGIMFGEVQGAHRLMRRSALCFLVIATEMLGKKLGLKKSSHGHRAVFL